jgi:hypothetical protein
MAAEIAKLDFLTIQIYQAEIRGRKVRARSRDTVTARNLAFCAYSDPYQT